ncbi:hypothetical protein [Andreprevotia chitinilytica]|uniref:hypothetical protein n=1 Tax=Andreprevotia chitinilytica TaxID=396808 RepID=UPI0006904982|nr:hypothetical protein [Andreprevotia chitinilytica]
MRSVSQQILISLTLVFCTTSMVTFAVTDEDGYDEYTIRKRDIPIDAPKFAGFPAKKYEGPNAAIDFRKNPDAREYRTRLTAWSKARPNFAGHYILATWGCGTNCTQITIINARTGKVYQPEGMTANSAVNVEDALLDNSDPWYGSGSIKFQPDSRLLMLVGMPEERTEDRGISWFVWEEPRLKRIRFIPKGWYPAKE